MSTTDVDAAPAPRPRPRREGVLVPVALALAAAVAPWVVVGWWSLGALVRTYASPGDLRVEHVVGALPVWCLMLSVAVVLRDGASARPRTEPALLAAVPMLGVAAGAAWVGDVRFGFAFWDGRVDLWLLAVASLATVMVAVGVRYPLRRGVWGMWILAAPPVATWAGVVWSEAAQHVAGWTGGADAPAWIAADIDGLAMVLACWTAVALARRVRRGRRVRAGLALAALVVVTGAGRTRVWDVAGDDSAAIVIVAVLRVVLVAGLAAALLVRLADADDRPEGAARWFARARVEWTRRYVVACSVVIAFGVVLVGYALWSTSMRTAARGITADRVPVFVFDGGAPEVARIPARRSVLEVAGGAPDVRRSRLEDCAGARLAFCVRRSNVDLPQQPPPWDDLVLPVAGSTTCRSVAAPWWLDVFLDASVVVPFVVGPGDGDAAAPVDGDAAAWLLVVPSSGLASGRRVRPTSQFRSHLARLVRTRQVAVRGGAATLSYQVHHGMRFASVHWTRAVRTPTGRPLYRTVVVAVPALAARSADVSVPRRRGELRLRVAHALSDLVLQEPDRRAPDADFAAAGRTALGLADAVIRNEHAPGASAVDTSHGVVDCPFDVELDDAPRVVPRSAVADESPALRLERGLED